VSVRAFGRSSSNNLAAGFRASAEKLGGVGIYAGELFFALIAEDALYFKVDDSNRSDFEARGMSAFRPYREHDEVMSYYQVPGELLEEPEELGVWAEKAVEVARRSTARASRPRGPRG